MEKGITDKEMAELNKKSLKRIIFIETRLRKGLDESPRFIQELRDLKEAFSGTARRMKNESGSAELNLELEKIYEKFHVMQKKIINIFQTGRCE